MKSMSPWLDCAKQIQAISQAGQAYSKDKYDLERFDQLSDVANQMFSHLSNQPVEAIQKLFIPESGYPTPKVDLRAGIIRDNKILLVKEIEDGGWSMPGGWADVCESPSQGVVREVFEESGIVVDSPKLIAIKDRSLHPYEPEFPFHIYKLFFVCRYVSGEPKPTMEISEANFFELNTLPNLSTSRVLPEDIEMVFRHADSSVPYIHVD
ncbi:NUDIX hydrolase [Vibrio marisflavi]|uniref:Nudix hydrolase domain-containing protein n=1 Tax=Vibrio marisflavi CECT 7928 TaxID=634439 RepID=A0ABN8DXJ2_9VIBR|nr:NUDIX hydrolase [Vibrio marisflavi]CAH0535907.1 hypothetical protein VMF7928_00045 [Vibrio marisflavi CECT 7928]